MNENAKNRKIERIAIIDTEDNAIQRLPFIITQYKNQIFFVDGLSYGIFKSINITSGKLKVNELIYSDSIQNVLDSRVKNLQLESPIYSSDYEIRNVAIFNNHLFSFAYLNGYYITKNSKSWFENKPVILEYNDNGVINNIIRIGYTLNGALSSDSGAIGFTPLSSMVVNDASVILVGSYYDSMEVNLIPISQIFYQGDSIIKGEKICDLEHPQSICFLNYKDKKEEYIDKRMGIYLEVHIFQSEGQTLVLNSEKVYNINSGKIEFELPDTFAKDSVFRVRSFMVDKYDKTKIYIQIRHVPVPSAIVYGDTYLLIFDRKKHQIIQRMKIEEKVSGLCQDDDYVYFLSENDEGVYLNKIKK